MCVILYISRKEYGLNGRNELVMQLLVFVPIFLVLGFVGFYFFLQYKFVYLHMICMIAEKD